MLSTLHMPARVACCTDPDHASMHLRQAGVVGATCATVTVTELAVQAATPGQSSFWRQILQPGGWPRQRRQVRRCYGRSQTCVWLDLCLALTAAQRWHGLGDSATIFTTLSHCTGSCSCSLSNSSIQRDHMQQPLTAEHGLLQHCRPGIPRSSTRHSGGSLLGHPKRKACHARSQPGTPAAAVAQHLWNTGRPLAAAASWPAAG